MVFPGLRTGTRSLYRSFRLNDAGVDVAVLQTLIPLGNATLAKQNEKNTQPTQAPDRPQEASVPH